MNWLRWCLNGCKVSLPKPGSCATVSALRVSAYRPPSKRQALMGTIGTNGPYLFVAFQNRPQRASLRCLPGVGILRQVWLQQYLLGYRDDSTSYLRLRTTEEQPPAELCIHSPYDVEARYRAKHSLEWGATRPTSPNPVMRTVCI